MNLFVEQTTFLIRVIFKLTSFEFDKKLLHRGNLRSFKLINPLFSNNYF